MKTEAFDWVAVLDDDAFDRHAPARRHPECPERLAAARDGLRAALPASSQRRLAVRDATVAELERVHSRAHLSAMSAALDGRFRSLDADTYVSPGSRDAAFRAAGAAAVLGDALARGEVRRGFGLLRPPGHHAERDRAMGFCLFNNVAVAASSALAAGAKRVAVVDWDVHHGNGTQQIFESDPSVLFISLHQWPLYPGTGAPEDIGRGPAVGTTANLALPPGSGPEDYAHAFRVVVRPLLASFGADVLLVSAGYDAHVRDPLGAMRLDAATYGAMASELAAAADALGHGKVGFILEGGYDLQALEGSVSETVRGATGATQSLPDGRPSPAAAAAVESTRRALEPHHALLARPLR